MNKEEIKEWLDDISTPTGISYSGDRTLSNSEVEAIIDFIDELQQEIKQLKEIIEQLQQEIKQLKEIIDKVIEMLNESQKGLEEWHFDGYDPCLNDIIEILER